MMPRLFAFALMLSASMTTPASSQTAEQQMFLQANPGLAQQLQRQLGAQRAVARPRVQAFPLLVKLKS